MNNKNFIILCVFVSILGIIIMFVANKMLEPENVRIHEITLDKNYVIFNATITGVQVKTGLVVLNLKDDTGSIEGVIYENQSFKPGTKIEILGKPQKYKQKIQVRILNFTVVQVG